MIPGVLINDLDLSKLQEEDIHELKRQNDSKDIKIVKIAALKTRNLSASTKHHAIIIYTHEAEAANRCIKGGFNINHRSYPAEKYAPQYRVTRCYNCQRFGHHAAKCRGKTKCGNCASHDHTTKNCTVNECKCVNCGANHKTQDHNCSHWKEETAKMAEKRRIASVYFNE